MSTLGKILAILNSVVAVLLVGFLVYKYAADANNRVAVQQTEHELRVAREANKDLQEKTGRLAVDLQHTKSATDTQRQQRTTEQEEWKTTEDGLKKTAAEAQARAQVSKDLQQKVETAQERMKKEVDHLLKTLELREGDLVTLHKKFMESQDLVMALDRDVKMLKAINHILATKNVKLEIEIEDLTKGPEVAGLRKDPRTPNPPAKFLKGQVERVDATDKTLVRVSLGTDHGLKINNTLEVFRFTPAPEYVGMIRIEDTHPQASVGRLVRAPGAQPRTIRAGDLVASSLKPRE